MRKGLLILGIVLTLAGVLGLVAVPLLFSSLLNGSGSFESNGERVFFTGQGRDGAIPRRAVAVHHHLASGGCVGCHGEDGRGGNVVYGWSGRGVETPDIRYQTLTSPHEGDGEREPAWSDDDIEKAVREGTEPSGERLNRLMPRWRMGERDMRDLLDYLKDL